MSGLTLESIGLTQEELQDRLVQGLIERVFSSAFWGENGELHLTSSPLGRKLQEATQKRIDQAVNDLADRHILPNVTAYLEALVLGETNKWGEKKGKPVTFIEYLTQRADAYMHEQVDHEGKGKGDSSSYSWRGTQTRIAHLVHHHLHYSIDTAMKEALKNVNSAIAVGLAETCKIKLAEAIGKLKVGVSV